MEKIQVIGLEDRKKERIEKLSIIALSHCTAFPRSWHGVVKFLRAPWDRRKILRLTALSQSAHGVLGVVTACPRRAHCADGVPKTFVCTKSIYTNTIISCYYFARQTSTSWSAREVLEAEGRTQLRIPVHRHRLIKQERRYLGLRPLGQVVHLTCLRHTVLPPSHRRRPRP